MASDHIPTPHRGKISWLIMLATIMQTLDSTIANVALPHMQGSLSASQDQISWVLTSYIVAAAIGTPLTGWLSDRFSRRKIMLWSIAGFTLASALCGLSESLTQIVAARLLQGFFGAALAPLAQATLLDINPRERQGQAMAVWGMGVMVGPIIGPTLGGWLTENYDWRWVFFINLPIGLIAGLGIARYMPRQKEFGQRKFDLMGFVLLSFAVGLLQLFMDRGEQLDWFNSTEIRVEAFGALASALLFMAHTGTAGIPSFIDLRILRDRNFVTGVTVIFMVGLVMFATRALLPPMAQGLMGYSVISTGMVMAPSGAGTVFAMLVVGRILKRVDLRLVMLAGFSLTAFSLWQMGNYSLVLSESNLVWPGVIQGMGLGLVFVPLSTVAFSSLSSELRAAGTSLFSLARNIGSSIGISIFQTLLSRTSAGAHARLAEHVTIYSPLATDAYDLRDPVVLSQLNGELTRQAGMIGYVSDFRSMMYLTLAVMPLVLMIRIRPDSKSGTDEPVHMMVE